MLSKLFTLDNNIDLNVSINTMLPTLTHNTFMNRYVVGTDNEGRKQCVRTFIGNDNNYRYSEDNRRKMVDLRFTKKAKDNICNIVDEPPFDINKISYSSYSYGRGDGSVTIRTSIIMRNNN